MYTTTQIRDALEAHKPSLVTPGANTRQAAVAIILREHDEQTGQSDMLFIQRANRDGDPWSGQMAFPGGHREPEDPSLMAAAMRETHEEIGLSLATAEYLGSLESPRSEASGKNVKHAGGSPRIYHPGHARLHPPIGRLPMWFGPRCLPWPVIRYTTRKPCRWPVTRQSSMAIG